MDHRSPGRHLSSPSAAPEPYGATVVWGGIVGGRVVGGSVDTVGAVVLDEDGGGGSVAGGLVAGGLVAGGSVAGGLVAGGLVAGGVVATKRGAVVTTGGCVAPVPPEPGPAPVVEVDATVDDVEAGPPDVVVVDDAGPDVVVARAVVEGDWVATCCFGEVSLPVASSKSRAARATDARAYSPTLKR